MPSPDETPLERLARVSRECAERFEAAMTAVNHQLREIAREIPMSEAELEERREKQSS